MSVNFAPAPIRIERDQNLIDENLDYRKRMAQQMMQAGISAEPVQHWTQGAARMAQALVGSMWDKQVGDREQELTRRGVEDIMGLMPPAPSVTGGMPAIPQTALQPSPSVSNPSQADISAIGPMIDPGRKRMAAMLGGDALDKQISVPATPGLSEPYANQVKKLEGFTPVAAWDYKQNSNGYGTKARYPGERIDQPEAERRFTAETQHAASLVGAFAPDAPEGVKAALTSLTYNAGTKWMQSGLGDAVKRGDWQTAQQIFLQYNKAGGQTLPGLVDRRKQEAQWFNGQPQQQAQPVQVADAGGGYDRETLKRMYFNPQTRELATKLIIQDNEERRKQNRPLTQLEQATLEHTQASTKALLAKPTKEDLFTLRKTQAAEAGIDINSPAGKRFVLTGQIDDQALQPNSNPSNVATNIAGGLDNLARVTSDYREGNFLNATGTYQGDPDSVIGSVMRLRGDFANMVENSIHKGASTSEIRNRIAGDTEALATTIKPLIRKPGEGAWTDADQARLVSVVGNLAQSNSVDEYRRNLEGVRQRIMSNFGIQLPEISGGGAAPQGGAPAGWSIRQVN